MAAKGTSAAYSKTRPWRSAVQSNTLLKALRCLVFRTTTWIPTEVSHGHAGTSITMPRDPAHPYPWNGCDPFPTDSTKTDPWGNPRNGRAWIIAQAINAVGDCQFFYSPFPSIQIDPTPPEVDPDLNPCSISDLLNPQSPRFPTAGQLPYDYKFAPAGFINASDPDDYVRPDPAKGENDGRLIDFLRQQVGLTVPAPQPRAGKPDPLQVLANAVTLSLDMGTTRRRRKTPFARPMARVTHADGLTERSLHRFDLRFADEHSRFWDVSGASKGS
jgi:hypothetical protein